VHQKLAVCIIVGSAVVSVFAECLSFERTVALLAAPSNSPMASAITGECFCEVLSNNNSNASEVVPLIQLYAKAHPINDTVLFCAYRHETVRNNASVFATIVYAWKQRNPSPASRIQHYQQAGAFRSIDTLCSVLDYDKRLDTYLLLRWIDTKQVLDDLDAVPELFCRVIQDKKELLPLALNQFAMLLQEVPPGRAASLLNKFCGCGLDKDTLLNPEVLPWVIEQYGIKRLFTEQIDVALKNTADGLQRYELLHTIALQNLSSRCFIPASRAAQAAYDCAASTKQKKESAAIIYKSYKGRDVSDSARIWFERSDAAAVADPREDVEVYLNAGDYVKAAERIRTLPESFVRDTLQLRQLLLSDQPAIALEYAFKDKTALARSPFSKIWRVRTALFSGNIEKFREILDSAIISPSDCNAPEILDFRYWLMRLSASPEDLAKFAQIEYTLFKGERDKATPIVCGASVTPENRWRFSVRVARQQLVHSETAAAIATLQCISDVNEPEYLFCYADALYRKKELQRSKRLLERIIMEFPSCIYTEQARLLLSQMNK
jgi:hypothetical protein